MARFTAVACAATFELWRRDSHTGSAFVTVPAAARPFPLTRRYDRDRLLKILDGTA